MKAASVPKEFVSLQGFMPESENNLITEPPKYPPKRSSMTQLEARRISYLAFPWFTVGPRFKSWRAHQPISRKIQRPHPSCWRR